MRFPPQGLVWGGPCVSFALPPCHSGRGGCCRQSEEEVAEKTTFFFAGCVFFRRVGAFEIVAFPIPSIPEFHNTRQNEYDNQKWLFSLLACKFISTLLGDFASKIGDMCLKTWIAGRGVDKDFTGNVQDLPPVLYMANFHASEDITGNIRHLPASIRMADFHSASGVTGKTSDLPSWLCFSDFHSARSVGHITGHPPTFQNCDYYYEQYN